MDNPKMENTEVQTTKVADTTSLNGADADTDTAMTGIKQEEKPSNTGQMDTVKTENGSPMVKHEPQPSPEAKQQSPPAARNSRSPDQKRKASRSPSSFTKRQRTSHSPSTHRNHQYPDSSSARENAGPRSVRPGDDKARNKRLFGGMLTTIAAKPSQRSARAPRPVDHSKREGLERRAAERERARLKEEEDARRERELRRREENKEEYIAWERDTILARADNDRIRAEFLETKAKPALYYKPYILTKEQKITLNQQIGETEAQIDKDIRKYEETHPDQPPLAWKPLPPPTRKDSMDVDKEGSPQVSPPFATDTQMKDEPKEEPVSKTDGAEPRSPEQKKDKPKADDFDEDVIETSEGGVSLIY